MKIPKDRTVVLPQIEIIKAAQINEASSYSRLGRIDNPSGLASTLGSGNVTVEFVSGN